MTTFFQVFYISKLAINDFYTDAWGEDGAFHYTSELSEFMVSYIMRQELGGHATSFKFSLSSTDNEKKNCVVVKFRIQRIYGQITFAAFEIVKR